MDCLLMACLSPHLTPTPTGTRKTFTPDTGAFDNDGAKALTIAELTDFEAQEKHKHDMWVYFFAIALQDSVATDIIQHPEYEPGERTVMIFQDHVPDVGTGAYEDVAKFMAIVKATLITTMCFTLVFLFGDQQTFSRMVWRKRKHPVGNEWVIPAPGGTDVAVCMCARARVSIYLLCLYLTDIMLLCFFESWRFVGKNLTNL